MEEHKVEMEEEIENETEEVIFKRFPKEKQDQVRQLVNFAVLMGLDGKDLISIGGRLERIAAKRKRDENLAIIKSYTLLPIGQDAKESKERQRQSMYSRFKLETINGNYYFECVGGGDWKIRNPKTKASIRYYPDYYGHELPKSNYITRSRNVVLLDVHCGKLQLNF
jgi:hypothetical protein